MAVAATSTEPRRRQGTAGLTALTWRPALALVVVGYLIILAIYRDTAISLVEIWSSSNPYGHGFLVLPAAIFLFWLRRNMLKKLPPQPSITCPGL